MFFSAPHSNEETPSVFLCNEETPSVFLCNEETPSVFLCTGNLNPKRKEAK